MFHSLKFPGALSKPSIVFALSVGVGLIYLAFLKPVIWGIDGNEVLKVAYALVTEQRFSLPTGAGGLEGADGQSYSIRYLLLPIVISPLVAVGVVLSAWLGLPALSTSAVFAIASSVFFTTATTVLVALLALRLGSTKPGAYMAALAYAFGTIALTYAQTLFSEPLLAFLTIACVYFAFGFVRRAWILSSLFAALAILAKPTGIVLGPVVALYFWLKRYPLWVVLGPVLAPALGGAFYLFYNYLRFGNPFITGQPVSVGLSASGMLERFWGFLFGFGMGGGLLWYCPPVALAVIGCYKALKTKPVEAVALLGISTSFVGLHSFWFCCGWDWGPRFLVPLLPLLMALVGLIDYHSRKWLLILSAIGFVINAPTLFSFYQRYYWELETAGGAVTDLSLWTALTQSPLLHVWGAAFRQVGDALQTDVRDFLSETESMRVMQIVPTWWWMLPVVGIPVWMGGIAAGLMVAIGISLLIWGWPTHQPEVPVKSRELSVNR